MFAGKRLRQGGNCVAIRICMHTNAVQLARLVWNLMRLSARLIWRIINSILFCLKLTNKSESACWVPWHDSCILPNFNQGHCIFKSISIIWTKNIRSQNMCTDNFSIHVNIQLTIPSISPLFLPFNLHLLTFCLQCTSDCCACSSGNASCHSIL